jgi:hypothetical protein
MIVLASRSGHTQKKSVEGMEFLSWRSERTVLTYHINNSIPIEFLPKYSNDNSNLPFFFLISFDKAFLSSIEIKYEQLI